MVIYESVGAVCYVVFNVNIYKSQLRPVKVGVIDLATMLIIDNRHRVFKGGVNSVGGGRVAGERNGKVRVGARHTVRVLGENGIGRRKKGNAEDEHQNGNDRKTC